MSTAHDLSAEKYIAITTYKRSGDAVTTPVWVVAMDDGALGFYTSTASGKAKRLAHTPRVTVQACDMRGRIAADSQQVAATARVVAGGSAEHAEVMRKVKEKYGFMVKVTKVMAQLSGRLKGKPFPYADCAVIVSLG